MSNSELIVACANCSEEVEFPCKSIEATGPIYLEDDELSIDQMTALDGKTKDCPRCEHTIKLLLTARLKVE